MFDGVIKITPTTSYAEKVDARLKNEDNTIAQ
jgi:hypothetical protein